MQVYRDVIDNGQSGVPVAGCQVLVKTYPDGSLATLLDASGNSLGNPFTSSDGSLAFQAANGKYTITVSGGGIVTPVVTPPITLFDPADATASQGIANGTETVADSLNALQLADYTALRAYAGPRKSVYVAGYLGTAAPSGIAGMFVRDDSDTTTADNGGTVIVAGNGKRWKRRYSGPALDTWFGVTANGTSDDTSAWLLALGSGVKWLHHPAGRRLVNLPNTANLSVSGLSNMLLTGDGPATVIYLYSRHLCFLSPSHVTFRNMRFEGNPTLQDLVGQSGSTQPNSSVWCSNFTDITFDNCEFANFGGSVNYPDNTVCLWLYAGPNSSMAAAGNSEGALVNNCRFYGNSRHTNFGVRVFTEWGSGASLAYSNTGAIIKGSTFSGFNWNAVELAGPMTSNALISDCVANVCGLTPFDIDKGASNCRIENITINRLLGNYDTSVTTATPAGTASTRAGVVSIQGETTVGRIAVNSHVDGVVANLLAADIQAFGGFGGFCGFGYSNAKNCSIKNVQINIDAVPTKNAAASWAFAVGCFESISGCEIDRVTTTNATHGIMETAANIAGVGTDWNEFRKIRNVGTMKGECIYVGKSSTQLFRHRFEDIKLATDISIPAFDVPAINLISSAANATVSLDRVYVNTAGYSVLNASVPNLALRDVWADFGANSNNLNFFASGSACTAIFYSSVYFNSKPLDVYVAFPRLPSGCKVNSIVLPDVSGSPVNGGGGVPLYATNVPTNPLAANWSVPSIVWNLAPSAGGTPGWVNYGGFWKAMANIAA